MSGFQREWGSDRDVYVTVAVQSVYGWSGKRGKCSSAW